MIIHICDAAFKEKDLCYNQYGIFPCFENWKFKINNRQRSCDIKKGLIRMIRVVNTTNNSTTVIRAVDTIDICRKCSSYTEDNSSRNMKTHIPCNIWMLRLNPSNRNLKLTLKISFILNNYNDNIIHSKYNDCPNNISLFNF